MKPSLKAKIIKNKHEAVLAEAYAKQSTSKEHGKFFKSMGQRPPTVIDCLRLRLISH